MRYTVILEPQEEGGYTVTVPALPGCISEGDTREESIENIKDAITLYIKDLRESGEEIPSDIPISEFTEVEIIA
ncbi:MAG: type II toxin-antitoxin system HicB family antitoxin [Candidatus Thermoplasmatota archaeon]|jgi:predicted RNase H-like HicB family nuclease|nr:type II toxin-antitoxin system HicB family antitoxin [Candidatus Thermoplasmatota archaeon]